jgi:Fe-S-cluster containining protein
VSETDPSRRVEVHPGCEAVVEFDPERTFECVPECTWCCHHGVMLYGEDLRELAARESIADSLKQVKGQDFVRREEKEREEHVDVDGAACFFLREDGLCALHAEHDWKPARCSVFPLSVRREDGDLRVDVREDAERNCEGMDVSERRLIDELDAFLPPLLWKLDEPDTHVEL